MSSGESVFGQERLLGCFWPDAAQHQTIERDKARVLGFGRLR